jgi:hypothetical protein
MVSAEQGRTTEKILGALDVPWHDVRHSDYPSVPHFSGAAVCFWNYEKDVVRCRLTRQKPNTLIFATD